jgi:DnaK suppressor protein
MKKSQPVPESPDVYRQMLQDRRREVLAGLGGKFDVRAALGRVAEDDQAQISHDEFVSLRLNSLDYARLRMIDEALDRVTAGDFGICLSCEEPIASKRLRAIPWARYCVACQDTISRQNDLELARA